jgi:hypothetical protein
MNDWVSPPGFFVGGKLGKQNLLSAAGIQSDAKKPAGFFKQVFRGG